MTQKVVDEFCWKFWRCGCMTSSIWLEFGDLVSRFRPSTFCCRISCTNVVGSDALVEIRSLPSACGLFIYFKISRDTVVNGLDFYLLHLGLIPDVTIWVSGSVRKHIWLKCLWCNANCPTLLMCTTESSLAKESVM